MASKKRARIGKEANATLGVAVDPLFDNTGEDNPPTITLPDSSIPEQTTPVPTPAENATIPPVDIHVPPPALASGPGISDGDLRGAIQMLTQLVASQAQSSNVATTLFTSQEDSSSSRMRDERSYSEGCRASRQGADRGTAQSSSPSAATSSAPPPTRGSSAPTGRGAARGGAQILFDSTNVPFAGGATSLNGWCELRGHIQRECRSSRQGAGRGTAQPSSSAAATSSAPPPAQGTPVPAGHGAARGGAQSSGRPSRFYAMSGRQNAAASLDVVTGILTVQTHDVYALIDPNSTLSYITPYVAMEFGIEPEQRPKPFSVSTLVG
ncbi:uncharacterized protein [Nicotiana tomentosiformis]|uniref:uncharacterized protein n=1 Tax=Nicotiana tomentosiformis TaxID=4098 RepID=UPI00388C3706